MNRYGCPGALSRGDIEHQQRPAELPVRSPEGPGAGAAAQV
jgi:hypothetical protein